MNGNEVWLTGCNWFGYNTGTNLFDGVWNCNLKESLESIADHGFNLLRVPMSSELILQWKKGEYPEPHGKPPETPRAIWNDSNDPNNWKKVAEKAGNAILNENPNALIVIEGIEIYPKDPQGQ